MHLLPLTIDIFYHHSFKISSKFNRYVIEIKSIKYFEGLRIMISKDMFEIQLF